jgi:hypothetical protein
MIHPCLRHTLGGLMLLAAPFLAMAADPVPPPTGTPPSVNIAPPSTTVRLPGNADGSCPATALIKVGKSGIYHLTSDPNYALTKAKACFVTPEAAEQAGYRAPRK